MDGQGGVWDEDELTVTGDGVCSWRLHIAHVFDCTSKIKKSDCKLIKFNFFNVLLSAVYLLRTISFR